MSRGFLRGLAAIVMLAITTTAASAQFSRTLVLNGSFGGAQTVVSGDVDGDGFPEIVLAESYFSNSDPAVWIFPGQGGLLGGAPTVVPVESTQAGARLADMDGDGDADIVTGGFGGVGPGAGLVVLRNDGGVWTPVPGNGAAGNLPASYGPTVAPGEVDGDGVADVAVLNTWAPGSLTGTGIAIHANDGTGVLTHVANAPLLGGLNLPQGPLLKVTGVYITAADFDGDGLTDFAAITRVQTGLPPLIPGTLDTVVTVHLSTGSHGLTRSAVLPTTFGEPGELRAADLNEDGLPDLVVTTFGDVNSMPPMSGGIDVFMSTGGGMFAAPVSWPVAFHPRHTRAGDVDGDGDDDLVCTNADMPQNATANALTIVENTGGGVLAAPVADPTGLDLPSLEFRGAGDIDLDGRIDVIAVGFNRLGVGLADRADALFPGSGDDFVLASGPAGAVTSIPPGDAHVAAAGDLFEIRITSPGGTFTGDPTGFVIDVIDPTDPPGPLATTTDAYVDPNLGLVVPLPALPATGIVGQSIVPPFVSGITFIHQAYVQSANAASALGYAATDAHRLFVRQ